MLVVVRFSITANASSRHHEIMEHCHQTSFLTSQAHAHHLKMTATWTITVLWLFVFLRHRNFSSPQAIDRTLNITVRHKWDHNGMSHHLGTVRQIKNKAKLMSALCEQLSPKALRSPSSSSSSGDNEDSLSLPLLSPSFISLLFSRSSIWLIYLRLGPQRTHTAESGTWEAGHSISGQDLR